MSTRTDYSHGGVPSPGSVGSAQISTTPGARLPWAQLANTTLVGAAANIDLTGLSAAYNMLRVMCLLRGTNASATIGVTLQFNGDTGANYDTEAMPGIQNVAVTAAQTLASTSIALGSVPAASASASTFGIIIIEIPFYANTGVRKVLLDRVGFVDTTGSFSRSEANIGSWRNTAAIDRVTLIPSAGNFVANSQAIVHGMF